MIYVCMYVCFYAYPGLSRFCAYLFLMFARNPSSGVLKLAMHFNIVNLLVEISSIVCASPVSIYLIVLPLTFLPLCFWTC